MSDKNLNVEIKGMIKIKVERELDAEFVGDVLVTACDGQYGGIWYWAKWSPWTSNDLVKDGDTWTRCVVWPEEMPGGTHDGLLQDAKIHGGGGIVIDANTIRVGMQRLIDGDTKCDPEIVQSISLAVLEGDAGHIDSEVADAIVQAGWFGTLIYG